MICQKCGSQKGDTDPFCPNCGVASNEKAIRVNNEVSKGVPSTVVVARPFERYIGYMMEIFPLILLVFLPVAGALLATTYMVFRDAIFNGQSVGKKLIGIKVVKLEGYQPITVRESALRNFPLAIGFFCSIVPVIGHIVGSTVSTIVFIIEAIAISTDKDHRRLGDKLAGTIVVKE